MNKGFHFMKDFVRIIYETMMTTVNFKFKNAFTIEVINNLLSSHTQMTLKGG